MSDSNQDTIFHVTPVVTVTPGVPAGEWITAKQDEQVTQNNHKIQCLSYQIPSSGKCIVNGGTRKSKIKNKFDNHDIKLINLPYSNIIYT